MWGVEQAMTLCAEALFASALQESDRPTPRQVRTIVADTLDCYRPDDLSALLAQEAGDHPDRCRQRMQWAQRTVCAAYTPVLGGFFVAAAGRRPLVSANAAGT